VFGLKESDLQRIIDVLRKYPEVKEARIYGSRAIGNYKPGSDIDISLMGNVSWETTCQISAELNEHLPLPYEFDITAYVSITYPPLKEHIDQYGKPFYRSEPRP